MVAFKGRHLADLMEAFAMAGLPYDGLFMAASRRARQMADMGGWGRGGAHTPRGRNGYSNAVLKDSALIPSLIPPPPVSSSALGFSRFSPLQGTGERSWRG